MKYQTKKRVLLAVLIILGIIGVLAVVAVIFEFVLYLKGFRFVYPEQFENSWNAVSGIAAWAGVVASALSAIASFLAIIFAVRVADKQNKIELFEKKYEIYEIAFSCDPFSKQILNAKNNIDIQLNFYVAFCYAVLDDNKAKDRTFLIAKYLSMAHRLNQVIFLFKDREILVRMPELIRMIDSVISVSFKETDDPDLPNRIQKFVNYIDSEDYKKLIDAMQKELSLK